MFVFFIVTGLLSCFMFALFTIRSENRCNRFSFMMILFAIAIILNGGVYDHSKKEKNILINECEKELPRSEKCVLIAVPEYTVGE